MTLEEIAAGIETVERQHDRGVATADDTGSTLVERLQVETEALPCTPEAAATVLETYAAGSSIGASAAEAGVVAVTGAKVLHRCGAEGVTPLSPTGREVLRDWLAGELPRSEALALTGAEEAEFALATYVETHEPHEELVAAAAPVLTGERGHGATSDRGQPGMEGTLPDPDEFL